MTWRGNRYSLSLVWLDLFGETKVGEFELALVVDEQVLRFEITVEDSILVAEGYAAEKLPHEGFDSVGFQCSSCAAVW